MKVEIDDLRKLVCVPNGVYEGLPIKKVLIGDGSTFFFVYISATRLMFFLCLHERLPAGLIGVKQAMSQAWPFSGSGSW